MTAWTRFNTRPGGGEEEESGTENPDLRAEPGPGIDQRLGSRALQRQLQIRILIGHSPRDDKGRGAQPKD
jgi:hypothetical protein